MIPFIILEIVSVSNEQKHLWKFGCLEWFAVPFVAMNVNTGFLICIALERTIAVIYPFQAKIYLTVKTSRRIGIIVFILASSQTMILYLFGLRQVNYYRCDYMETFSDLFTKDMRVATMIAFGIITLTCYSCIAITLIRRR